MSRIIDVRIIIAHAILIVAGTFHNDGLVTRHHKSLRIQSGGRGHGAIKLERSSKPGDLYQIDGIVERATWIGLAAPTRVLVSFQTPSESNHQPDPLPYERRSKTQQNTLPEKRKKRSRLWFRRPISLLVPG